MKKLCISVVSLLVIFSCGKQNLPDKVEEHIKKNLGDNPNKQQIEELLISGQVIYGSRPEEAKKYFEAAAKYDPRGAYALSDYYLEKEEYENFEKWAKQAAEGGDSRAQFNLGYYYDENSRLEEAKRWYIKAGEQGDSEAQFNLGIIYFNENNWNEAEKWYLKAIQNNHSKAYNALGRIYSEEKRFKEAEYMYLQALESGNNSWQIYSNLGYLYYELGDYSKSLKFLEIALSKDKENKVINCNIMKTKEKLKKYDGITINRKNCKK